MIRDAFALWERHHAIIALTWFLADKRYGDFLRLRVRQVRSFYKAFEAQIRKSQDAGRIARSIQPRLAGYECVGLIASLRDVRDCAMVLQAMAGPDWRDFDCIEEDSPDFLEHLDEGAAGLRLAWTDDYGFTSMYAFEESPGVIAAVRAAAMGLKSLGAEISTTGLVWEDFFPGYMTTNYLFGSPLGPIPRPERAQWVAALETRQHNWRTFRKVFAEYDLLLSPTSQLLAAKVEDWAERWAGKGPVLFPHQMFAPHYTSHTHMFNWLGFPAINVPAGFIDGLPIGLQIVGPPRSEAKIFRVAHAFLKSIPEARTPKGLVNSQGAWVMPRLDGVAAPVQLRRLVEPAREQQRTIAREQMAEAWRIGTWAR